MSDKSERDGRIEVHKVPVLDTGIGKGMGYENDEAFLKAAEAEQEAALANLRPEARATIERALADHERHFLFGDDADAKSEGRDA